MEYNEKVLLEDIRERLSDYRYNHSLRVASSAKELAGRFGGDAEKAYVAGIMHDVLKEQGRDEALEFFSSRSFELTRLEKNAPKLWHAMAAALYCREKYNFPEEVISAIRYHTTGKLNMTLLEKILFVADFISADRDYNGVEEMRRLAAVSLELCMTEGLRFSIEQLSAEAKPIHPDTIACYNENVLNLMKAGK